MLFGTIYGVDFSGAKLAGRNTWVAQVEPAARGPGLPPYELTDLAPLEGLCGTAERAASLAHLVRMIASSEQALWAMDFPFGLPVELMEPGAQWPQQVVFLQAWGEDDYGVGLDRRAIMRNGGGDALEALVAAVGAVRAWHTADHGWIARHPRYPREGRLYV